jgi:hypothetical protein
MREDEPMTVTSVSPEPGLNAAPWMVGCLRADRLTLPHPMSARDIAADARFADMFFERIGIGEGAMVLFTSGSSEYAQFWPYEQALEARNACVAVAENLLFDAGRSEMFMRRLPIELAFGIGDQILDGMAAMNLDIAKAFASTPLICARDGAADRLRDLGFSPWRMVSFGPAFGYVSPDGTSVHDDDEWLLEAPAGEILISAKNARAHSLVRYPTGVRGSVARSGGFALD